jgi:hypothetical protein
MNLADERFRKSPQQAQVFELLSKRDAQVADWYDCAVFQLAAGASAARFRASAHLIRLMLNELPKFFQMPQLIPLQPLTDRLEKLKQPWQAACASPCRTQGGWRGSIDAPIGKFLSAYEVFSTAGGPQRSKQEIAGGALRRADPAQVAIPVNLVDLMAERWIKLHKYFTGLAHGSAGGTDRFEENLEEVERMVCAMLAPRPSEHLAAIDDILAEENSGA